MNGSYGAGSGLNQIDLITNINDTILKPKEQFGNFPLVGALRKYDNSRCYTICQPLDSFTYRHLFANSNGVIIDFGDGYLKNLDSKVVIDDQNNILYLDDDHDMVADTNFLKKYNHYLEVSKRPLLFEYHNAYLSPDGKYMFYDDYKSNFYLLSLQTFEKIKIVLPDREIHSVTWSDDCKRFAVVQDHETLSDTDKIRLV